MIKLLMTIGKIAAVASLLYAIGAGINKFFPWDYLTYIFIYIRDFLKILSPMIDISSLIKGITMIISAELLIVGGKIYIFLQKHTKS